MKKRLGIIAVGVIVDQILKLIIFNTIGASGQTINLIPGILQLTYVENTGAAFGFLNARWFLVIADILIIFFIIKILLDKKYPLNDKAKTGLSLIISGGIGNLIDRIFRGFVIDYIDITQIIDYPVFNFADILVVVGVILIIATIIVNTVKSQESINENV